MFLRRKIRAALTWVVLFTVLFNVALPVMAAIRAQAHPAEFTEICFASGIKRIALPHTAGDETVKRTGVLHNGHCDFCVMQFATYLPPSNAAILPIQARPAYVAQELPQAIPSEHVRCSTPPAQAPPVFS